MSKNKNKYDLVGVAGKFISSIERAIIEMSPMLIFFFLFFVLMDRTSLNPGITQLIIYTLSLATILYLIHLKIKGVNTLKTEMLSCSSAIMLSIFILTFVYPSLQTPWSHVEDIVAEGMIGNVVEGLIGGIWLFLPGYIIYTDFCGRYGIPPKLKFRVILSSLLFSFTLYLLYFDHIILIAEEYASDIARTAFYILFGGLAYIYLNFLFLSNPWKHQRN
ncbi:MAG: hypothetical protein U9Q22_00740 [Candidatus Altiarchaeota archaeon]|nr:hypothetical protein [Candidatus Altiarchaeota archaeon]